MRLTQEQKAEKFDRLWYITQECYGPVETPSREKFARLVEEPAGTVFTNSYADVQGYALVTTQLNAPPLLRSIAVMPAARGLGLGMNLLNELANYYRSQGWQRILLHVRLNNPAQKIYFDAGYRVTKVLSRYYDIEDGLEMEKVL